MRRKERNKWVVGGRNEEEDWEGSCGNMGGLRLVVLKE